jgi:hypothetical protein
MVVLSSVVDLVEHRQQTPWSLPGTPWPSIIDNKNEGDVAQGQRRQGQQQHET